MIFFFSNPKWMAQTQGRKLGFNSTLCSRDLNLNAWEECPNFSRVEAECFHCTYWYAPVFIKHIHTHILFYSFSLQTLKFSCFITQKNIQTITSQFTVIRQKQLTVIPLWSKPKQNKTSEFLLSAEPGTVSQTQKSELHANPPPDLNNQYELEDTLSQNRLSFQQCWVISRMIRAQHREVLSAGKESIFWNLFPWLLSHK